LAKYKTGEDMVQVMFSPQADTPGGVTLTHVDGFCLLQSSSKPCATHYTQNAPFCVSGYTVVDIDRVSIILNRSHKMNENFATMKNY